MKQKIFTHYFLLLFTNVILPFVCLSQLNLTNETSKTVYVAINWLDTKSNHWMLEGWFKFYPGGTRTLLINPLTNSYIYFYAHSEDNVIEWKGNGTMNRCLPDTQFHLIDNTECPEGYQGYSFLTINTGGETYWRHSLTSTDYPVARNSNRGNPNPQPQTPTNPQPAPKKQTVVPAINYVSIRSEDGKPGTSTCYAVVSNQNQQRTIIAYVYSKETGKLWDVVRVKPWSREGISATMCYTSCYDEQCRKAYDDLYIKEAKFAD